MTGLSYKFLPIKIDFAKTYFSSRTQNLLWDFQPIPSNLEDIYYRVKPGQGQSMPHAKTKK